MRQCSPHPSRAVRALGLVVALVGASSSAFADDGDAPAYSYAQTASAIVVRYVEIPGELAEADRGPTLTVRGDGSATVHYPAYMRRAGDYTTTLPRAELDGLVALLVAKGVPQFDAAAVRQQVQAAATTRAAALATGDAGATLTAVSDPSTTIVELAIAPPAAAGATVLPAAVTHRAEWHGLQGDTVEYPEVGALAELLEAQRALRALMGDVHTVATQ